MFKLINTVYKLGRLKNYEMGEYRWYSYKFLRECKDDIVPWQIGYARALCERSDVRNIVGVVENDNKFTIVDLETFLKFKTLKQINLI